MWLNEKMIQQNSLPEIEGASVTMGGDRVEAVASVQQRNAAVYAPYGYAACVPAGEEVLLLSAGVTGAVAGIKMRTGRLAPGEVEITSAGGAKIRLCKDGSVKINSMTINSKGEIES